MRCGLERLASPEYLERPAGLETSAFPAPLALNVVPWAGTLGEDGWSSEEAGLREETRKVLGLPQLPLAVTCVRVPVVTAHSLTVHAGFANEVTVEAAREVAARLGGTETASA